MFERDSPNEKRMNEKVKNHVRENKFKLGETRESFVEASWENEKDKVNWKRKENLLNLVCTARFSREGECTRISRHHHRHHQQTACTRENLFCKQIYEDSKNVRDLLTPQAAAERKFDLQVGRNKWKNFFARLTLFICQKFFMLMRAVCVSNIFGVLHMLINIWLDSSHSHKLSIIKTTQRKWKDGYCVSSTQFNCVEFFHP